MKYLYTLYILIIAVFYACGARVPEHSSQLPSEALEGLETPLTGQNGERLREILREVPYYNFQNVGDTLSVGITEIEPLTDPKKRTLFNKIFSGSKVKDKSRITNNYHIRIDNSVKDKSVVKDKSTVKDKSKEKVDNSTKTGVTSWKPYIVGGVVLLLALFGVLLGRRFKLF